jgi:hypothetical protein
MQFSFSQIETCRFGVRSGRCDDFRAGDWEMLASHIAAHGCELVTIRCDAAELEAAQTLITRGANLMDTIVTMEAAPLAAQVGAHARPPDVWRGTADDAATVDLLAREAFGDYVNHYRADRKLDASAVTDAMAEWTVSFTKATGNRAILLGGGGGKAHAFGAMAISGDTAEGVLHGVSTAARGKGWYRALLIAGMHWGLEHDCTRMTVTTQLHNMKTQRTMSSLGMRISDARYTFHLWV